MKKVQKKAKKIPVCAIWWRDAAYTYTKEIPKDLPPLQVSMGFIIDSTRKFTNIAMNVDFDSNTKSIWPVDGFVIPEGVIKKFKRIGWLN